MQLKKAAVTGLGFRRSVTCRSRRSSWSFSISRICASSSFSLCSSTSLTVTCRTCAWTSECDTFIPTQESLVKKPLKRTELVRTGDDRPSLGFLCLDQPFLDAHLEECGQGLKSRVFDIHRGLRSFYELKGTVWQDMRLVENRWRDWEGPGRQFRQRNGD